MVETGAIFKGFTFNGIDSKDYGIYITGEAVYNAPERDVEFITIPGRNGDFALDHGRYSNIEVTYPAGFFGEDETDFTQGIADIRNILCSQKGYLRLEDEYNPGEYRMAVYKSGLEVSPAALKGGEFDITFVCKPQRFLTTGETPVSLSSGDSITNPTLYESKPLLVARGLGDIGIGGETVTITNAVVGNVDLAGPVSQTITSDGNIEYIVSSLSSTDSLNTGDAISVPSVKMVYTHTMSKTITTATVVSHTNCSVSVTKSGKTATYTVTLNPEDFVYKTSGNGALATFDYRTATSDDQDDNGAQIQVQYVQPSTVQVMVYPVMGDKYTVKIPSISGYSTKSTLPDEIYIDLDIGEAFYYDADDNIISLNNVVNIPAQLPSLVPGANTVTFDNTITALEVTPRWWQL